MHLKHGCGSNLVYFSEIKCKGLNLTTKDVRSVFIGLYIYLLLKIWFSVKIINDTFTY